MCRYAEYGPYKDHYACFRCRKGFKRHHTSEWPKHLQPAEGQTVPAPCPECGEPMANMGLDFKPPRQTAKAHWEVVEFLFRNGVGYHSCGCSGPGYRPSTWSEVEAFLEAHQCKSAAQALLKRFGNRKKNGAASRQRTKRCT
jgi:hypothetical protein